MLPCYIVDAFVGQLFSGNPAAVVLLEQDADTEWMQKVAAEFNLSETSFLLPRAQGEWQLRWFTPTTEVNLCGHATLAAAHVLEREQKLNLPSYKFHTRSGELIAAVDGDLLVLDFPRARTAPMADHLAIIQKLGLESQAVRSVDSDGCTVFKAGEDLLVELPTEEQVQIFEPNQEVIASLKCRGFIVTARGSSSDVDFVSRFFAPAFGIPEDPVTGSAHCALADYWQCLLNKTSFKAKQLSARGGYLNVDLKGDRVLLKGRSKTMVRGQLDASA
jgi:PhzF family phenazine biosynthesis protein